MDYKVYEYSDKVVVEGIKDFNLIHTFECGQCFRWNKEKDNSYTGVAYDKVINVKIENDFFIINNTNLKEFNDLWRKYFDLDTDYLYIKNVLKSYNYNMKKAIDFGWGIRILNQNEWECMISFIISANNFIPRIKSTIEKICKKYGRSIKFKDKIYYSFPSANDLKNVDEESLRECGCGYRWKYIIGVIELALNKKIQLDNIKKLDTENAKKELMKIYGIGNKVSDCILLFSMQKYDVFPTDVWIQRIMKHFYLEDDCTIKDIQNFSYNKFGNLSGFAQQYLFYYARENKI